MPSFFIARSFPLRFRPDRIMIMDLSTVHFPGTVLFYYVLKGTLSMNEQTDQIQHCLLKGCRH